MTFQGGAAPRVVAKSPIVEMDGDEMSRVIWAMVKNQLIEPFVDVRLEAFDLHLPNRDRTDDAVTVPAAEAIRKHGVGIGEWLAHKMGAGLALR